MALKNTLCAPRRNRLMVRCSNEEIDSTQTNGNTVWNRCGLEKFSTPIHLVGNPFQNGRSRNHTLSCFNMHRGVTRLILSHLIAFVPLLYIPHTIAIATTTTLCMDTLRPTTAITNQLLDDAHMHYARSVIVHHKKMGLFRFSSVIQTSVETLSVFLFHHWMWTHNK